MHELPYRRRYTRTLIVIAIAFAVLFPLVPQSSGELAELVRLVMWTYGVTISTIVAPTLLYAGLRTKNWLDAAIGLLGMLPICFWFAWIVYH
ncbi:MAG: hypothetical protein SFV81_15435 [Pirellulaceae bacterium]|nr:hypothetical protein [Pirellulaceae bacterium]